MLLHDFVVRALHDSYIDYAICLAILAWLALKHALHVARVACDVSVAALRDLRRDVQDTIERGRKVADEIRAWAAAFRRSPKGRANSGDEQVLANDTD
jgi:hypothetical protein